MLGQRLLEDRETARVFSFELHAGWAVGITRGKGRHSIGPQRRHYGVGLSAKLLAHIRLGAIAAAGHAQRQGSRRMAKAEMQRSETTHREATDMRLLDTKMIEHHENVVRCAVLAIGRRILRHVRRRIAARGIGDGPVTPAKMLKLLFPAAMIAGEFMDEDDRRAASGFLIIWPYAVIRGCKSHGQLRFSRWSIA